MAETASRQLQVSRSELYATAIAEFLERRDAASLTERLNRIYAGSPAVVEPALRDAQLRSIRVKTGKNAW